MLVRLPTLTIKAKMRSCFIVLGAMFLLLAVLGMALAGSPITSAVALLGALLTLCAGVALYRAVLIPLDRAIGQLSALSAGNLVPAAPAQGPRLARLERELVALRDSTRVLVGGMTQAATTVGQVAGEIARESQQLAARTDTQLDFLQRTAQSFDQITATIVQSADHAANAQSKVQAASRAAADGLTAIRDVAGTMAAIGQSSREIEAIISLIDSIAFQTNILALNAAVESARAGEQGRGFSVVAAEVRTLAQRSANAAREVKALIERSAGNVLAGHRLVSDADERMQHIVRSIGDGAALMSELATASNEQTAGVEQAKAALYRIDEMARQNAERVGQNAHASQRMHNQVEQLMAIVAPFRIV